MNRRDFLSLRVTREGKMLELSCHALYMRCLDTRTGESAVDRATFDHEPWMGEPPASFTWPTTDDLLAQVSTDLEGVQRVRLLEPEWLASTDLGHRLTPILAAFRARGGEVMFEQSG